MIKKLLGEITSNPIFALPKEILALRNSMRLTHGVMVTLLILVQSFKVRILMGQQDRNFIPVFLCKLYNRIFLKEKRVT